MSKRVTRHQHHKQILLTIHYMTTLWKMFSRLKYLGITITDNMDWGQHISEISSTAIGARGFLPGNYEYFMEVAYNTLVRP